MKKILVRVITYNQEEVISRALDSVLRQKEWGLYRVIVSDDCSTDRTWDILQEYKAKYPDIMDIHRNEHNLGIMGNVEKVDDYVKDADYDLLGGLSGDDEYCDGYFKGVQELIEQNKIETTEAVGIYSDWKAVKPSGKTIVYNQKAAISGYQLWSLKARGIICGRSLLVTKSVMDKNEPILTGYGLNLTESHYESQPPLHINKAYYLPQVTTIYYTGIGVSTRLSLKKSDYLTTQNIEKWKFGIEKYVQDERDYYYALFQIKRSEYYIKPKWKDLIDIIRYYRKSQIPEFKDSLNNTIALILRLVIYKLSNRF